MIDLQNSLCTACELSQKSRVNCMKGAGPLQAPLMFVGEAPGEDEEQRNKPFVGPAGEVFDMMLMNAGIRRDHAFITNTARCRPTDLSNFRMDRTGNKHYGNLTPTELQSYTCGTKWLDPEIAAVKPKVIVAMGNVAAAYLLEKHELLPTGQMRLTKKGQVAQVRKLSKISDLVFSEHWSHKYGAWVVPMFHPSFVMRSPEWFIMMVELLRKAARIAEKGVGTEKTDTMVVTNFDDAIAVLNRALEHKLLADDHETDGLDWRFGPLLHIGLSWKEGTGASIRLVDNEGRSLYTPDQKAAIVEKLTLLYGDPEREMVGYNAPFDDSWLKASLGITNRCRRPDVQIVYHALNCTATHKRQSLETLSWLYTDMANFKDETKPYFDKEDFLGCPIDVLGRRNCSDVDATLRLRNRFMPKLQASPSANFYEKHLRHLPRASTVLHLNGANIDLELLRNMRTAVDEECARLTDQFCASAGVPTFKLTRTKLLQDALYVKLGLPVLARSEKTNAPSTRGEILEELAKTNPILQPLIEYKKLQKLIGTYILGLRGAALFGNPQQRKPDVWTVEEARAAGYTTDGRVHPSFSMIGTITGRPSTSRPNTANQPRPTPLQKRLGVVIRRAFAAPPGKKYLERDQSQAELRVLAALSGDTILMDAISSEEGVHRRTAANFFRDENGNPTAISLVTDEMKDNAKTTVFAIVYGGSEYTVEEEIWEQLDKELRRRHPETFVNRAPTKDERRVLAREYIDRWTAQYPKAARWLAETKEQVVKQGYVTSVFGQVFLFPLAFSKNPRIVAEIQRQAANYLIQSVSNHVTMMAGIRVQNQLEAQGMKAIWINFVYDALGYEVPEEEVKAIGELVRFEMEKEVAELSVKWKSEIEVGQCWKEEKPEKALLDKLSGENDGIGDRYEGAEEEEEEAEEVAA